MVAEDNLMLVEVALFYIFLSKIRQVYFSLSSFLVFFFDGLFLGGEIKGAVGYALIK